MRPTIQPPKKRAPASRVQPKTRRTRPKKGDAYMSKVVNLLSLDGKVIFRGTRRECLRVAKKNYNKRMLRAKRASSKVAWF